MIENLFSEGFLEGPSNFFSKRVPGKPPAIDRRSSGKPVTVRVGQASARLTIVMPFVLAIVTGPVKIDYPRAVESASLEAILAGPAPLTHELPFFLPFEREFVGSGGRRGGPSRVAPPAAEISRVQVRLQTLADLPEGWLDGDGAKLPSAGISWVGDVLTSALASGLPEPALFPTPAGNVLAEWSAGVWEISAEFDLAARSVEVAAVNVATGDDRAEFLTEPVARKLVSTVNHFV